MNIIYEWDIETVDENGDIVDHHHENELSEFTYKPGENQRLVLVRNVGDDANGLDERSWAYVVNNKLPEYFTNDIGWRTVIVPKRFRKELERWNN